MDGVGSKVGVGHRPGNCNRGSVVDKGSCVMDKGSCVMDKGSCVMGGSIVESIVITVGKAIVVSVRKTIVITKRVRVSNHRVVINKGAVGLSMSGNTAVVVSIGISLGVGFSFSIGFSCTTLTAKVDKRSHFMVNNGSDMVNHWGNMVNQRGNMVNQRGNMVHKGMCVHLMRNNSRSFND